MRFDKVVMLCRKIVYTSKQDVKRAMKGQGNNSIKTIYKCELCDGWHGSKLTKKEIKIRKKQLRDNLNLKG